MATTGRSGASVAHPVGGGVPPDHQARQVPGRTAGHEAAARPFGQAGQVGEDPQRLVLGGHRSGGLDPRGPVQRRAGHHHVEQQGGLGRRGGDERQELRAVARHHGGGQGLVEQLHDHGRVDPARGHQPVEAGGQRLVDGAAVVERHRVERQAPPAVVEDEVGQLLVVDEHRVAHDGPFWFRRPLHDRRRRTPVAGRRLPVDGHPVPEGRDPPVRPPGGGPRRRSRRRARTGRRPRWTSGRRVRGPAARQSAS